VLALHEAWGHLTQQLEAVRHQSEVAGQQAREGLTGAAARSHELRGAIQETARNLEELRARSQAAGQQLADEIRSRADAASQELATHSRVLWEGIQQAERELSELRKQARAAHEELAAEWAARSQARHQQSEAQARSLSEEVAAAVLLARDTRQELTTATHQSGTLAQLFQEARRQLALELEEQLRHFRQGLGEMRALIRLLPEELREARRHVKALGQQLPAADRQVQELQGDLQGVKEDLLNIRREVGEAKHEAEKAPPEPQNRLGVTVEPVVVVAEVQPATPAERAGLKRGDAILGVNGTPVFNAVELRELVHHAGPGEEISLQIIRGGTTEAVKLTSEPAASSDVPAGDQGVPGEPEKRHRLGVTADPGVVVVEVLPGTPAESAGLAPGDVIAAVNDAPVHNSLQLREAVQRCTPGEELILRVTRGPETNEVRTRLEEAPTVHAGLS
jgi:predicted metalloprotease with PDZ domain